MSKCKECRFELRDNSCEKGRNNKKMIFSCEDFRPEGIRKSKNLLNLVKRTTKKLLLMLKN